MVMKEDRNMKLIDLCRRSWMNLWRNKYRSILTIISAAIGSAAIITMVSVTALVRDKTINKFISGTDMLKISASEMDSKNNDSKNILNRVLDIKKINGVKSVSAIETIDYNGWVTLSNIKENPMVVVIDTVTLGSVTGLLKEGSGVIDVNGAIGSGDIFNNSLKSINQCVINLKDVNNSKDTGVKIPIHIDGIFKDNKPFITENIYKNDAGEYPSIIYIPVEKAEQIKNDNFIIKNRQLIVYAKNIKYMDSVINTLKSDGFEVTSVYERVKDIKQFFLIIQLILGFLGGITLVISAICTANTMNMAVMERRKEIGIFKAIGVKFSTIRLLFIIEAAYIGVVGSIIGLGLSIIFSSIINHIFKQNISIDIFQLDKLITLSLNPILIVFIITVIINILASASAVNKAISVDTLSILREE